MNIDEMNIVVKNIRKQYEEKDETEKKLEELRKLDREVKRPAKAFAYAFGTVGSLVMGTGMCLAMDAFGKNKRVPGILIGTIGMAMMGANHSLYRKKLEARKQEYAQEILERSEDIFAE